MVIRTGEAAKSGVSIKLEMLPFFDLVRERREEQMEQEAHLIKLLLLADEVYGDGGVMRSFGWEEAQARMDEMNVQIEYRDDYLPEDPVEKYTALEARDAMELLSPIEKIQAEHPMWSEEECREWYEDKLEQEKEFDEMKAARGIKDEPPPMVPGFDMDDEEDNEDQEDDDAEENPFA